MHFPGLLRGVVVGVVIGGCGPGAGDDVGSTAGSDATSTSTSSATSTGTETPDTSDPGSTMDPGVTGTDSTDTLVPTTGDTGSETSSETCEPIVPLPMFWADRRLVLGAGARDHVGLASSPGGGLGTAVAIYRSTGLNPSLTSSQTFSSGDQPPAWGDVDGDGLTDMMFFESGNFLHHRGGDGELTLTATTPGMYANFLTDIVDVTGDKLGELFDIEDEVKFTTWPGDGLGGFIKGETLALAGPDEVGFAVDKVVDPRGRMAMVSYFAPGCDVCTSRRIVLLVNDGAGLTNPAPPQLFSQTVTDPVFADLDDDDVPELVMSNWGGGKNIEIHEMIAPGVLGLRTKLPGQDPRIADIDGDGRDDVLTSEDDHINIYLAATGYMAEPAPLVFPGIDEPIVALVADLDGDGIDDFVVTSIYGHDAVLVRSGCG